MEAATPELDLYLEWSDVNACSRACVRQAFRTSFRQKASASGSWGGSRHFILLFAFLRPPRRRADLSRGQRCEFLLPSGSVAQVPPGAARLLLPCHLSPLVTNGLPRALPVPPPSAHASPAPGRETPLNRRTLRASSPSPPGVPGPEGRRGRRFRYRAGLRTRKLPAWAVPHQGGQGVRRKWTQRERRDKRTRTTLPDRQPGIRSQRGVGNAYGLLFPTGSRVTLPAQPEKRIRTTVPDRQRGTLPARPAKPVRTTLPDELRETPPAAS